MGKNPIQPYASFRERAPGLWTLDGEWYQSPLKRRMTVLKLQDGSLLVHSPIQLGETEAAWLETQGKLKWVVVPNAYHGDEAYFYPRRFPGCRVIVSEEALKRVKKTGTRVDGVLPDALTVSPVDLLAMRMEGLRGLGEVVFLHVPSRTLIVTDLVFHLKQEVSGFQGVFLRWNEVDGRFGPSKLFKKVFLQDRVKFRRSFERLTEWDFDRVVMSHGEVLEKGGIPALKEAFAWIWS